MSTKKLKAFEKPSSNYSKLPHHLIDLFPDITTVSELKVILYVLRHTWGFSEYGKPKKMTVDEIMSGRKKKDGLRVDNGTGLSANSVRSGIKSALNHGLLSVEVDKSDLARIKKAYCLNVGGQSLRPDLQSLHPRPSEFEGRTEKETIERNLRKENTTTPPDKFGLLVSKIEKITGSINMATADFIEDLLEDWSDYVKDLPSGASDAEIDPYKAVGAAIDEAVLSANAGRPNLKYIRAILIRWTRDGYKSSRKKQSKEEYTKSKNNDAIEELLNND